MSGALQFLIFDVRSLTSSIAWLQICILIALVVIGILDPFLAQSPPSLASRFTGVWKREDNDDTVTLSVDPDAGDGDAVVMTSSNGAIGNGTLKGDKIVYSGAFGTDAGEVKVAATFVVSADGSSMINHLKIVDGDGVADTDIIYTRLSALLPMPSATVPPLLAAASPESRSEAAKPKPTAAESSPFAGTWRPADDSAKLTITVNGRNAVLKYSSGSRDSGTIRGNKIESKTVTTSDRIKSTDVFEMSSNGRTLIRRRALESPKGETGHETLTYNRAE